MSGRGLLLSLASSVGSKWKTGLRCLILVLGTLWLYWPACGYDFVFYDDPDYVFKNPTVTQGLSWWGLTWSFVDAHAANWHPLTWLSHMLDCQLFGLDPRGHHLVSVLLHALNTGLLFLLLRCLTRTIWRSLFVAALFAWHPLRVESVAWISERKDVLSGLFFILTLWMYALYASRKAEDAAIRNGAPPTSGKRRISHLWFYRASVVAFVLGLSAKPMLVTVPGVLLLLDYWPLNRFDISLGHLRIRKDILVEKLPFVALSAVFCVITVLAQRSGGAVISLESRGLAERFETLFLSLPHYLGKTFWPDNLTFLYLPHQEIATATVVLAIVLWGLVAVWAWADLSRGRYAAVGLGWFVGMLVPVSGLVQVGLQTAADRYTYLPGIGLSIACVWGGYNLVQRSLNWKSGRALLGCLSVLVVLACGGRTRTQLGFWRNTETLMDHALEVDPQNYIAHLDLAVYLASVGRTNEAVAHRKLFKKYEEARTSGSRSIPVQETSPRKGLASAPCLEPKSPNPSSETSK